MRFQDKVAMVTGAAVGIGRACAVRFAQEGAFVVALDINANGLKTLQEEVEKLGGKILTVVCDVSDENSVNSAYAQAYEHFGNVDILVNNAALWRCWAPFLNTSVEDWKKFIDVNVMGVVYCTRAVLPKMLEQKYGRIINVASVAGVYGNANMVHYSATKGALISMTKALAKEVVTEGILVNAVSPGTVSSSEVLDYDYVEPSELNRMERTGSDMENANLICFLASEEASYIAAQNILIDGCRLKI